MLLGRGKRLWISKRNSSGRKQTQAVMVSIITILGRPRAPSQMQPLGGTGTGKKLGSGSFKGSFVSGSQSPRSEETEASII